MACLWRGEGVLFLATDPLTDPYRLRLTEWWGEWSQTKLERKKE